MSRSIASHQSFLFGQPETQEKANVHRAVAVSSSFLHFSLNSFYCSFSALHKHFSLHAILNLFKKSVLFSALCPLLPGLHGPGEVG